MVMTCYELPYARESEDPLNGLNIAWHGSGRLGVNGPGDPYEISWGEHRLTESGLVLLTGRTRTLYLTGTVSGVAKFEEKLGVVIPDYKKII